MLDPFGSGNQNRSHAAGSASASWKSVGETIRTRTKCGAIEMVSITVAVWSRAPKLRNITPCNPRAISGPLSRRPNPPRLLRSGDHERWVTGQPACNGVALRRYPELRRDRADTQPAHTTQSAPVDDLVQTKGCLTEGQTRGPWSAGGGTRTLKLFRAPAPKTGMFANFITPAGVAIVPPRPPDSRAAGDVIPAHACMACLT